MTKFKFKNQEQFQKSKINQMNINTLEIINKSLSYRYHL